MTDDDIEAVTDHPGLKEVRETYVYGAWENGKNGCDDEVNGAEFDHWLASYTDQIRGEERAKVIKQLQEVHRLDPWARRNVFAGVDLAIRMIKGEVDHD